MSEAVTGQIKAWFELQLTNPLLNGISSSANAVIRNTINLKGGTDANQSDRLWFATDRVLADGTSEAINLNDLDALDIGAGAGRDPLGQVFTMVDLIAMVVLNHSGSIGDLIVGGEGTSNAWTDFLQSNTDKLRLPPGAFMLFGCGAKPAWTVDVAGNNQLLFAASGGQADYDIYFCGRHA